MSQFAALAWVILAIGIAVAILAALVSLSFATTGRVDLDPKHKEGNMLVLSRKSMERIHIGDSVVVTVLEIRGNKARIGIDAPKEVHVLRSELQDRVSDASGNGSRATVAPAEPFDPGGIEALETDGPSG